MLQNERALWFTMGAREGGTGKPGPGIRHEGLGPSRSLCDPSHSFFPLCGRKS